MRDHSEEPSLLLDILERLDQRRVLVTFNGKSFDWPLLQTRFQMTRASERFPSLLAHLDLLHPARQLWRLRLQSVALTQLERHVLQFDRGQDIPSETIPQRYFDFLRGGPPEPMAEVFRHNQMDFAASPPWPCGLPASSRILRAAAAGRPSFSAFRACCKGAGTELSPGASIRRALEDGLPTAAEQVARRELAVPGQARTGL